jgi:hypothetical protein
MLAVALLHLICLRQESEKPAALVQQVAESGRCVTLAESPDSRVRSESRIAPGQPPILMFRYYEGKLHHRFGNGELMLDDAGH